MVTDTVKYIVSDTVRTIGDHIELEGEHIEIDKKVTATANYIAGIPDSEMQDLQGKRYYQDHVNFLDAAWKKIERTNLIHINGWVKEQGISHPEEDTMTVFYPFSGPDFLYAHSFFPYSRNYILVGLERAGTLPNFGEISDQLLQNYLTNMRHSLRFTNDKGYFVTKQMLSDFAKQNLDGNLHIILFYLVRTGHSIINVSPIFIDQFGQAIETDDVSGKNMAGIKINFCDSTLEAKRTVYYFRLNLENENMRNKPEFWSFLSRFGEKATYMKSASYILHNSTFSVIRKLVLNQSAKILQDDTGVPFRLFNKKDYHLKIYGNYSKTIKVFKYMFQPDLKAALDAEKGKKLLPFKIGYNSWYNEMVLIYAKSKRVYPEQVEVPVEETTETPTELAEETPRKTPEEQKPDSSSGDQHTQEGVFFKVQIKTASSKIGSSNEQFKGLPDVDYYYANGAYKYTIGREVKMADCLRLQKLAREKGFSDAFVVAFHGKERISIQEAQKLLNSN